MHTSRATGVLFVAVLVTALQACTPTEGGQAQPDPGGFTSPNPSPSDAPSSNAAGPVSDLADLRPCSLLSAEELSRYGTFAEPTRKDVGGARSCERKLDRQGTQLESLVVNTAIRETSGVSDAADQGMGVRTTEANGRQLAQIPDPLGCTVAIGVTESSSVDIAVSTTVDTEQACEIADELAAVVEPKLPKG